MIPYKLAKQLKDAGFPQKIEWGDMVYKLGQEKNKNKNVLYVTNSYFSYRGDRIDYKIPTLSELIDACIQIMIDHNNWEEQTKNNLWFFELAPNIKTEGNIDEIGELERWRASWKIGSNLDNIFEVNNYFGRIQDIAVAKLLLKLYGQRSRASKKKS